MTITLQPDFSRVIAGTDPSQPIIQTESEVEQIASAIDTFIHEIPESDLVRLARPPAPNGNGTTVEAQPVARFNTTVDHQGRVLGGMRDDDTYWRVGHPGNIIGPLTWRNDLPDRESVVYGNAFISREYAEAHAKRLRAEQRLRQIAAELNGDWRVDLAAEDNGMATIYYDHAHKRWSIDVWVYLHPQYNSWPAFRSRESAEEAIHRMGADMGDLL